MLFIYIVFREKERKKEKYITCSNLIMINEIKEIKLNFFILSQHVVIQFYLILSYDAPNFEAIVLIIGQQNTRSIFIQIM